MDTMTLPADSFVPYSEQNTLDLEYIRIVLKQQEQPVPADLDAVLIERGIILDD